MSVGVRSDELDVLFLLEILVDKVKIDRQPTVDRGVVKLKETCVAFKLLEFPPLIVTEEDFVYLDNFDDAEVNFKSGKSVLFSLPSIGQPRRPEDFVQVSVSRRVEPALSPSQHTVAIGKTHIPLGGSFVNLIKESNLQSMPSPSAKTIKGSYDLLNDSGAKTGEITVFLRLSCFGKLIVTEFEVKGEEASRFWFRGGLDTTDVKGEDGLQDQSALKGLDKSMTTQNTLQLGGQGVGGGGGGGNLSRGIMGPCIGPPQPGQSQQGPMMMPGPQYGCPPPMYCPPMTLPQYGPCNPPVMPMPAAVQPPYGGGGAPTQQGPCPQGDGGVVPTQQSPWMLCGGGGVPTQQGPWMGGGGGVVPTQQCPCPPGGGGVVPTQQSPWLVCGGGGVTTQQGPWMGGGGGVVPTQQGPWPECGGAGVPTPQGPWLGGGGGVAPAAQGPCTGPWMGGGPPQPVCLPECPPPQRCVVYKTNCLTDRDTQIEDGDVKTQPGDKNPTAKKSSKGSASMGSNGPGKTRKKAGKAKK